MSSFTIEQEGQPTRQWRVPPDPITVGRTDDAQLCLPDTSVSRRHASIETTRDGVEIADLGSANGTLVNGKEIVRWLLHDGDVVQLGTFILTFREHDGAELPEMDSRGGEWAGETTQTDALAEPPPPPAAPQVDLRQVARFELVSDDDVSWPVGDGVWFGTGGIPLKGVLFGGRCATVRWNGNSHVLTRNAWLTPVEVNGQSVKSHALEADDIIRIGTTMVRYALG